MKYILETVDLTKKYRDSVVVDHVGIHVPQGKIYALLGRNGAGKTTLMKMILGLVSSSGGSVHLFGDQSGKHSRSFDRNIGSMIESPGFYANLTAHENLGLLMRLRGIRNEMDVLEALEIVGLHEERLKPFSEYSLGMKQRLGIAAALMHRPDLLLLDEPINGLDPIGIAEIRSLLKSLRNDRGTTILVSSHDLSEVEQIADVVGIMHEGRLIEEIDLSEVATRTRRFIDITTPDGDAAAEILVKSHGMSRFEIQGDRLRVFESSLNSGEINRILVENGVMVTRIGECMESLEEYFSERIGGKGIA